MTCAEKQLGRQQLRQTPPWLSASLACLVLTMACGSKSKSSAGNGGTSVAPASSTSHGEVTTSIKYYNDFPFNNVYTADITLGGQTLETVLDTGSSNLLAIGDSSKCPGCQNEYGYNSTYTATTNSGDLGSGWSMNFLPIGEATVEGYHDTAAFNGLSVGDINFGLVTAEQGIPNIWGLAYAGLAETGDADQVPLFDELVSKVGLANQFSLRLCATSPGSSMVLGGFDAVATAQPKSVKWTTITNKLWYPIGVSRVYTATGSGSGSGAVAPWTWTLTEADSLIVDSGTNPLVFPADTVASLVTLLQHVAAANKISLPASFWPTATAHGGYATLTSAQIAAFPTLYMDVADATQTGKTFTLAIAPATYFQTRADGQRFLGLEAGSSQSILGTVFMENYVVLFDRGSMSADSSGADATARVGFYPIAGLCH